MMVLELTPDMMVRHGDKVIASRVESQRARDAHARRVHRQFLNDPVREAALKGRASHAR
jgi:hypothetical protein